MCMCFFIKYKYRVFFKSKSVSKNQSAIYETKTVLVSLSVFLLKAASSCICRAHTEEKVGHHSKIKIQSPSEHEYKK